MTLQETRNFCVAPFPERSHEIVLSTNQKTIVGRKTLSNLHVKSSLYKEKLNVSRKQAEITVLDDGEFSIEVLGLNPIIVYSKGSVIRLTRGQSMKLKVGDRFSLVGNHFPFVITRIGENPLNPDFIPFQIPSSLSKSQSFKDSEVKISTKSPNLNPSPETNRTDESSIKWSLNESVSLMPEKEVYSHEWNSNSISSEIRTKSPQQHSAVNNRSLWSQSNPGTITTSTASTGAAAIVGRRVKVYWDSEDAWFYGVVKEFDAARGQCLVHYDDHEIHWEYFQTLVVVRGDYHGDSDEEYLVNKRRRRIQWQQQQIETRKVLLPEESSNERRSSTTTTNDRSFNNSTAASECESSSQMPLLLSSSLAYEHQSYYYEEDSKRRSLEEGEELEDLPARRSRRNRLPVNEAILFLTRTKTWIPW